MVASQPVIVITSPRISRDLMDKRSASSSARTPSYMVDLVADGKHMALNNCKLAFLHTCKRFDLCDMYDNRLGVEAATRHTSKDAY